MSIRTERRIIIAWLVVLALVLVCGEAFAQATPIEDCPEVWGTEDDPLGQSLFDLPLMPGTNRQGDIPNQWKSELVGITLLDECPTRENINDVIDAGRQRPLCADSTIIVPVVSQANCPTVPIGPFGPQIPMWSVIEENEDQSGIPRTFTLFGGVTIGLHYRYHR